MGCTSRAPHDPVRTQASAPIVESVDNRAEVREFLTTRRAKLSARRGRASRCRPPARPRPAPRRGRRAGRHQCRVLRQARTRGPRRRVSASVLDALARALQLDDAERTHLLHLAQAADGTSALLRPAPQPTSKRGRRAPACSGSWTPSPAARPSSATAGWTCLPPTCSAAPCTRRSTNAPRGAPNFARYTFLDEDSHRFYPNWDTAADTCVAILRTEAGRDPHDPAMHDLVGELSTRSDEFRRRWNTHDVRLHGSRHQDLPPHHRRRPRTRLRKRRHALRTRTRPSPSTPPNPPPAPRTPSPCSPPGPPPRA